MTSTIRGRGRLAALAGAAALVATLVAGGSALAVDGGVHAAAGTIAIAAPATGGSAIKSTTARVGGSGAWTLLTGPKFREGSIGALKAGDRLSIALPANFEYNKARTTPPTVSSCDKQASAISYPAVGTAQITIQAKSGAVQGSTCTIDFGKILQVRPIDAAGSTGGNMVATFTEKALPTPMVLAGNAGTIKMVVAPTPTPTPTPAGVPVAVTTAATGGSAIPSSTARVGGTGAFTTLTGPTLNETSLGALAAGTTISLTLPGNFEWNTAQGAAPSVASCDKAATGVTYPSAAVATISILQKTGAVQGSLCLIDFGSILQVRPVDASAAGSGNIVMTVTGSTTGQNAGYLALTTSTPSSLSLSVYAPTMNNGAILWGEYVDLTTTAAAGTKFQIQVTTDINNPAEWESLTDSNSQVLNFTTAADGKYTYRYTPIRNYWYRAVAGSLYSNEPRVTVRQTIAIRPQKSGTQHVSAGTKVTFTATVRPARPELEKAKVVFELYKKSGSSWTLSKTATVVIDADGLAEYTFTFNSGSWYVRAQAQPTPVNANSFWSPNQYYSA